MSAGKSRKSWVELMEEEEEANKPALSASDVNPTPSKMLANQISNFHMLTPMKNEEAPVVIKRETISFDMDKAEVAHSDRKDIVNDKLIQNTKTSDIAPTENDENKASVSENGLNCDTTKPSKKEKAKAASSSVPKAPSPSSRRMGQPRTARRDGQMSNETSDSQRKTNDVSRKRIRPTSVSSATASPSNRKKRAFEVEADQDVLDRRQKQIDFGKNTIGYERYLAQVPKNKRTDRHPSTPPMNQKYSRRAWDGLIKIWRQQLHFWDPEPSETENGANSEPESNENNSLDESLLLTD